MTAVGLMLLGLAAGASAVWVAQERERRRVARLVRLLAPYHHRVGTAAPTTVAVCEMAGWRHV